MNVPLVKDFFDVYALLTSQDATLTAHQATKQPVSSDFAAGVSRNAKELVGLVNRFAVTMGHDHPLVGELTQHSEDLLSDGNDVKTMIDAGRAPTADWKRPFSPCLDVVYDAINALLDQGGEHYVQPAAKAAEIPRATSPEASPTVTAELT